jgi:hypothetical protein
LDNRFNSFRSLLSGIGVIGIFGFLFGFSKAVM